MKMPAFFRVICVASLLFRVYSVPGQQQFKFEHLTTADGMPSNTTFHIFEDHLGFLWFANNNGLVRYDGYQCKTFLPDSTNPYSISTDHVYQICEDSQGNLWINTEFHGINKYERKSGKFTHFTHRPEDTSSLSSDSIFWCYMDKSDILWVVSQKGMLDRLDTKTGIINRNPHLPKSTTFNKFYGISKTARYLNLLSLYEDSRGNMWFGTNIGIFHYDRKKNTYKQYRHDPTQAQSISGDTITGIYDDRKGHLWFGTWGGGVNCIQLDSFTVSYFRHEDNNVNSISNDKCYNIFADKSERLWITLQRCLDMLDLKTFTVKHFKYNPDNPYSLNQLTSRGNLFAIPLYEDRSGLIWINIGFENSWHLAYDAYDPKLDRFYHFSDNSNNPDNIRGRYFLSFLADHCNNIWISGYEGGLNKINPFIQQFNNYQHEANNDKSLINNYVTAVCESKSVPGNIWIGTHSGLDKFNMQSAEFSHYLIEQDLSKSAMSNSINSLFEDSRGILWIGTGRGYCCLDIQKNKFENHVFEPLNPSDSQGPFAVWSICEDKEGTIWMAEISKGLYACDPKTRKIKSHFTYRNSKLPSNALRCIINDSYNILWISSENGLSKFTPETETFTNYLSGIDIYTIKEDHHGNLWLGTRNHGLCQFDRLTGKAVFFTTENGLCNNHVISIVADQFGNLWLGTQSGLSKFNLGKKTFTNFYKENGMPSQIFDWNASGISNGQIWMTTPNYGIIAFRPEQLGYNLTPPRIVINSIRLGDKLIFPGDHSPLKEDITVTKEIYLKHFQNDITLECTALHYSMPQKNQYAFWLENYQKDWYYAGYNRTALYTNLNPGTYIFHVKASNCDNIWNEEGISLKIVISPPWWKTWWAYSLYAVLIAFLFWLIWREQLRRVQLRHTLEMKEFEANKLQEVNRMKSNFFASISHEFRTPLTLIMGPAEQLISEVKENRWKEALNLILKNTRQLLFLINQLLDFSKVEAGKMELHAAEEDIVFLLKGLSHSFSSLAEAKKISLTCSSDREEVRAYIDRDKFEKIISNLLSNAFKYTPSGGKIGTHLSVLSQAGKDIISIRVSDNGKGISAEHLEHIFDRYFMVDETDGNTGTGIGLALTKELVEMHKGTITAESKPGEGSTFIVNFLMGRKHLMDREIVTNTPAGEIFIHDSENGEVTAKETEKAATGSPDVLIVEDTEDVRKYIRSFLNAEYHIEEAVNGLAGFEKAVKSIPDLIISDIMMPEMDGIALCEKLKTDERTSHIPVILLTARAEELSKLKGLETGADAYITKPFSTRELKIRVRKLIEQRRKLRERFSRDITLAPKEISITSADERFLNKAMEIIEKHMSEPDFGVDIFGQEIGMSYSQLYRKVHALTNQSPVELIRSMRLKRAASLLQHNYGNIAEVAYETGFNTPSYFTECFSRQFGKLPSEFKGKEN